MRTYLIALLAALFALTMRVRMRMNPNLITTVDGLRDRRRLECRTGAFEDENEHTDWIEYWDGERLVHRSAHVRLKRWPQFAEAHTGAIQ